MLYIEEKFQKYIKYVNSSSLILNLLKMFLTDTQHSIAGQRGDLHYLKYSFLPQNNLCILNSKG